MFGPDYMTQQAHLLEAESRNGALRTRNDREAKEGHCAFDECDPAEEAAVRRAHAKRPGLFRRLFH